MFVRYTCKECGRVRRERTAGDEDHPFRSGRKASRSLFEEIHAGHLRHHEIGEDDVERLSGGESIESFACPRDDGDIVPTEDAAECGSESRLVVDDEDSCPPYVWRRRRLHVPRELLDRSRRQYDAEGRPVPRVTL